MLNDLTSPYIIAELSGNHNGSLQRAKKLISVAKECGADCVKLQTYTPETMTIKSDRDDFKITGGLWDGYTLWDLYESAHTPYNWQKKLFLYARKIGIDCISTPFDESAVDLLESIDIPFYKIASFELTDLPLVEYIASKKKPIILSTGMANKKEIKESIDIIKRYGCGDFVLLHCVSGYPTPIEEMNLNTIKLLRKEFKCEVGLSDHTLSNIAATVSIGLGVKIIEKHFTLKRSDGGPDAAFSMEPNELKDLCHSAKAASLSLGKASFNKKPVEEENSKFRRSIYIVKDIKKGDIFTKDNLKRIRPGYGLSPKYYFEMLGKASKKEVKAGTPSKLSFFQ